MAPVEPVIKPDPSRSRAPSLEPIAIDEVQKARVTVELQDEAEGKRIEVVPQQGERSNYAAFEITRWKAPTKSRLATIYCSRVLGYADAARCAAIHAHQMNTRRTYTRFMAQAHPGGNCWARPGGAQSVEIAHHLVFQYQGSCGVTSNFLASR